MHLNLQIEVEAKTAYGKTRYYAVDFLGFKLLDLIGAKTFTEENLRTLHEIGISVKIKPPAQPWLQGHKTSSDLNKALESTIFNPSTPESTLRNPEPPRPTTLDIANELELQTKLKTPRS